MKCEGCALARNREKSIELPGGWTVASYMGGEGYLGWLAIQPKAHRMSLPELTLDEAEAFLPNVKFIERALQAYWPDDRIERFYIVYFAESLLMGHPFHLHIHLIPRFASIKTKAWEMAKATKDPDFPKRYIRTEENVAQLMEWLRSY